LTQASTNLLFWNKKTDINELKPDSKGQKNINFNKKYWLGQINYVEELEGELSVNKNIYQIQTHSDIYPQEILQNENTNRFIYLSFDEKSLQKDSYKLILQSFKAEILDVINSRPQKEISNDEYKLYKFIVNNKKINEVDIKELLIHYNKTEVEINLLQAELDQLSKRGLILYYKNCESLKNIAWLQPAKTVAEIYKIFNENILRQYNGEISKDIFEKKINNQNLLELLKYNKVIFLDDKSKSTKYIIPGYLKSTTDEGDDYFIFGDFNKFNFILKFENFIPFGFMNQLICKYGGKYEAKSFRKDQLIFTTQEKDVKVLIRLDFRKLLIKVGVISKAENKISQIEKKIFHEILLAYWAIELDLENHDFNHDTNDFKKIITLDDVIGSYNNKNFSELKEFDKSVDIFQIVNNAFLQNNMAPKDMYLSIDGKSFVHYHTLEDENLITSNISSYSLKENGDLIKNENSILTIQFQNFSNNKNIKNMKKVFISYSHEDVIEKQRLMTFLKPLERSGKINIWQDLKLQAGVKVQQEILDKLDEADIIIMLVSQDFIGSDFIYDHELQIAMKKRIHNKVKILPVMISECTIFDLDLFIDQDENQRVKMGDYYFVPQDEKNNIKPIRLWESHLQDSAWKKVYEQLKRLLD
ncbi:TIR domain-containing protein, partial [uncultured Chryseobacterium sp.]|uniref:TIR domain-containing protein n=1 Tax=uncultured Chryseobacterium sp. TaxID=259322 RepID=UPI0027DC5871